MRLLFDENLSHKLVGILAHEFPGCAHVKGAGLLAAEDGQIWEHARVQGFMIVSKDTDFRERSYVEGCRTRTLQRVFFSPGRIPVFAISSTAERRVEIGTVRTSPSSAERTVDLAESSPNFATATRDQAPCVPRPEYSTLIDRCSIAQDSVVVQRRRQRTYQLELLRNRVKSRDRDWQGY